MNKGKLMLLAAGLLTAASFAACKEKNNEDLTESVNKAGSVETSVTVQHLDSLNDVLVTTHKVWVKGNALKDIQYRDTVPALGTENTVAENSDGDTKNVQVKKDYEIFITVK